MNKLVQLQNLSDITNADFLAITETWLNSNVSNSEIHSSNTAFIDGIDRVVKEVAEFC